MGQWGREGVRSRWVAPRRSLAAAGGQDASVVECGQAEGGGGGGGARRGCRQCWHRCGRRVPSAFQPRRRLCDRPWRVPAPRVGGRGKSPSSMCARVPPVHPCTLDLPRNYALTGNGGDGQGGNQGQEHLAAHGGRAAAVGVASDGGRGAGWHRARPGSWGVRAGEARGRSIRAVGLTAQHAAGRTRRCPNSPLSPGLASHPGWKPRETGVPGPGGQGAKRRGAGSRLRS